jgi:ATP-dependent helicase/nuclease subunit A
MNLSQEQQQAVVRCGQDVCVVAGPGSGKTRVLVERFAWLVEDQGVPPDRVLAFTFTEKAATEIKNRLIDRLKDNSDARAQMERAWVSTMHGFCARLLREYAIAAGIDPQFVVLDEQQAAEELADAVETALNELVASDIEGFRSLANAVSVHDLAGDLAKVYEASRISTEQPAYDPAPVSFDAFAAEVRAVTDLPLDGWMPKQRAGLAYLQEWLSEAAPLRRKPAGLDHVRLVGSFKCGLKPLKRGHPVTEAVRALNEYAP